MSIELFLYLVDLLQNIDIISFMFMMICIVALVIVGFQSAMVWDTSSSSCYEDYKIKRNKNLKRCLPFFLISIAICVFIPTKKTMYAMGAAHYAKQSNVTQKVLDLINKKLDDALEGEKT